MDEINQKLASAPDSGYAVGIVIGSLLPFLVLVLLAYIIYSYAKHKKGDN